MRPPPQQRVRAAVRNLRRSVECEDVYLKAYENLTEVCTELAACFDSHNHRRRHQGL